MSPKGGQEAQAWCSDCAAVEGPRYPSCGSRRPEKPALLKSILPSAAADQPGHRSGCSPWRGHPRKDAWWCLWGLLCPWGASALSLLRWCAGCDPGESPRVYQRAELAAPRYRRQWNKSTVQWQEWCKWRWRRMGRGRLSRTGSLWRPCPSWSVTVGFLRRRCGPLLL